MAEYCLRGRRVMPFSGPRVVSAIPNAGLVRGRFIGAQPEEWGSTWEIAVEESTDVEGMPNFVKPHIGQTIRVFVGDKAPTDVEVNDALQARVEYRGDERGGRFVV